MGLLNTSFARFFGGQMPAIRAWARHPVAIQQNAWQYLTHATRQTLYGQQHHFSRLRNVDDFRKVVPIQTYDEHKPYIDLLLKGRQQILWHTPIRWFAKSSGTTSDKSKFIPISTASLQRNHYQGGQDSVSLFCGNFPQTQFFTGKSLVIGGSHEINALNKLSAYGDLSAVLLQNMSPLARQFRTPDLETALLPDWEVKLERMAQQVVTQSITSLAGVPTWTYIVLQRVLELTNKKTIAEVWPMLEVYFHGGVSFTPYRQQFEELIGKPSMQYWQIYNASEGFFAVQDLPDRDDMLLMLNHGIFYEFLPLSELDNPHGRTLLLNEVELNQSYALIISTTGGLWRYLVGDTIQFTTKYPFRVQVTGRTKHFINAFGEEVMVDNTDKAIAEACRQTRSTVRDYTAAPVYFGEGHNGTHEWLIEFEHPPHDLAHFTNLLDATLQTLNSDYEAKRFKNMAMSSPLVRAVPQGTFTEWLRRKGKLGGQHKVPRLSNERKFVEEIWQLVKDKP